MTKQIYLILKQSVYSLCLVILLSSCNNSPKKATDNGNKPAVSNNTSKPAVTTGDANKAQTHTVSISEMKFQPEQIEVSKGDTVIWKNNDMVAHDVTQFPDKKWSSSAIPAGGSWKFVVTETSEYFCAIHPVMKGKLVVK